MSTKTNFTKNTLDALPSPAPGQRATYHDEKQAGLQLRVTADKVAANGVTVKGVKTFSVFARVAGGRPERITIGRYPAITPEVARKRAKEIISQLAQGNSVGAEKRASKVAGLTLAEAMSQYIANKRRRSDKLPLKERTIHDYQGMLKPGRTTVAGKHTKGGALARLAGKSIYGITADEIKAVHAENLKHHSARQAFYAMQTLKAILRFYAIKIPSDPFSSDTPEAGRIYIEKAGVSETEPVENLLNHLGSFWRALHALPASPVTDYLAFLTLTGCRPSEPLKILVGDLVNGEIRLHDTKNRSDHTLLLSHQALVIAERNAQGRAAGDRLFPITPAQANKVAHALSAATGIPFTPKMLRSLFASIADELVSSSTLKRMMNHKLAGDITDTNYIRKLKATLRDGWQKVADRVEATASDNVISIRGSAL
ncbi:tyrosine-type recombinase/integrase [Pseudomonas silesiensis]